MKTKYDTTLMRELQKTGKTLKEIAEIIGCSVHTVSYHLIKNRKIKQNQWRKEKYHATHLLSKMNAFKKYGNAVNFSLQELMDYIGPNPKCFFTGEPIDLTISSSYSLDHKIPRSRGGSSNLDNLVLTTSTVNKAKHNLLPEEFISLCKNVVNWK